MKQFVYLFIYFDGSQLCLSHAHGNMGDSDCCNNTHTAMCQQQQGERQLLVNVDEYNVGFKFLRKIAFCKSFVRITSFKDRHQKLVYEKFHRAPLNHHTMCSALVFLYLKSSFRLFYKFVIYFFFGISFCISFIQGLITLNLTSSTCLPP